MATFIFSFVAHVTIEADNEEEARKKYDEMELFNEEADVDFGGTTNVDRYDT